MKRKACMVGFCFSLLYSSPVSVPDGGTGINAATAYAFLVAGSTTIAPFQLIGPGTAGQGLVSAGGSSACNVGNVTPGYVSGGNFLYAGTTATLASAPSNTCIFCSSSPATFSVSATSCVACGYQALNKMPSTSTNNVAVGALALSSITNVTAARFNTAVGYSASASQTRGSNVAIGCQADQNTGDAPSIVAIGSFAGSNNSNNNGVTAIGYQAALNVDGASATAVGYQALKLNNAGGIRSTAMGYQALATVTGSSDNTAIGYQALQAQTTDSNNTALGSGAGITKTAGANNLYIGYNAPAGSSTTEANTIVIGNGSHTSSYLYGVTGVTTTGGIQVYINASSQMGTTTSSKKYKKNIESIPEQVVQKVADLNIVQFNYKDDVTKELQYGMIAEEVEKIFPETIVYDKTGEILTIQYHKFVPLALQYLQNKQKEIHDLECMIQTLEDQVAMLTLVDD